MQYDLAEFALKMTCPSNELLYDDKNIPSVMVYVPKFKMSDVITGGADSVHPAFIVNGTEVDGIYIGKYQSVVNNGRAYSLPGQAPANNMTWDTARGYCEAKGAGWHMMTKAEYAAIMLWCRKNGFQPKGNNNYGKDSTESNYKAIPCTYENDGRTRHVLTGTGPLTWSHNNAPDGIWDINGNVSEWTGSIRTVKGELQALVNNNAADSGNPQNAASAEWKAINAAATGANDLYLTPNGSGTTSGSIKVNSNGGVPQYATSVTTESESFSAVISSVTCASGISDTAKALLVALGLLGDGSETSYNDDRLYFNNVADERLFGSGGSYNYGANAGVGYCSGINNSRASAVVGIGFRLAYVALPSA